MALLAVGLDGEGGGPVVALAAPLVHRARGGRVRAVAVLTIEKPSRWHETQSGEPASTCTACRNVTGAGLSGDCGKRISGGIRKLEIAMAF